MARNRRNQRAKRHHQVEEEEFDIDEHLDLVTTADIWAICMGWLWSPLGALFILFCCFGAVLMPLEIYKKSNNIMRAVDGKSILDQEDGQNVKIHGKINVEEILEFETKYLGKDFTFAILEGTDRKVVIAIDELLTNQEKENQISKDWVGILHKVEDGEIHIKASKIRVIDKYRAIDIDIHDEVVVIESGSFNHFEWGELIYALFLIAGACYALNRVRKSIYFSRHPDEFVRKFIDKINTVMA